MILWHLATALFGFRWVFRDPEADLRWLMVGALAPDVLDLPIGIPLYSSPEVFAHSLAGVMVVGVAVLLFTDRRGRMRRNLMVMTAGWLIHLLADGIWLEPSVLWWPFAGWSFPAEATPFWPAAWERAASDVWRWVAEGLGLIYLGWLWRSSGLGSPQARRQFLVTGKLS
ncbi:MAG: metal-dependent hydrolase [bacterium]|nr:metal-dependent hydrolase [bacterium]MDE0602023.1 metal-dependent hydrolase [bacterium]